MKFAPQVAGGFLIAIVFSAGGYYMGNRTAAKSPHGEAGVREGVPARTVREPAAAPVNIQELRSRLDAEKNPLARFKMALQHLEGWVAKSPRDALDWLASQQPSGRRDEVIRLALKQYAETDAKGAADWALQNLTGTDLNNSLISIAEDWAQENGREAAAWFADLPVTQERDAAIENIFFSWGSNEPAAALDFLGPSSPLGDLTPTLRRAALAGWSKTDPEAAVASSLASSRTNRDPAQFANTLANWATMDLEGSSQWLMAKVPAGPERAAAVQELATIFAQQSPDAGVTWLDKVAAGPERDAAASALAAGWARSSPAEAANWAVTQKTIALSDRAISEIAHNYLLRDAAAFQAWRATLPDGRIKSLAGQARAPEVADDNE